MFRLHGFFVENEMNLIELENVSKRYADVNALDHVRLCFDPREWVSIVGPSGSGKTTLLNIIGGMDKPDEGDVLFEGVPAPFLNERERARIRSEKIGFVFQQHHLIPYLTAVENVMLAQYFHSLPDEKEAKSALEKVGLRHRTNHRPSQLSGGEQQRVCIARALINSPVLLLADEPTGDLDKENTRAVCELFKELHENEKFTLVIVTHNPFVAEYAGRIITLEDGKVVQDRRKA